MKKIIGILILSVFATLNINAQADSSNSDEVIIDSKKLKITIREKEEVSQAPDGKDSVVRKVETIEIIRKKNNDTMVLNEDMDRSDQVTSYDEEEPEEEKFVETQFMKFQLGLNNLINSDNNLDMPSAYTDMTLSTGKSVNLHWHIIRQSINVYHDKVHLVYGIGIDYNNYRFTKSVILGKSDSTGALTTSINPDRTYKKNKLVTQYLTVPLMMDFDIGNGEEDGVKLAFGANFGYLIGSHQKQKWSDSENKHVTKNRDDFNIEQFRVGYEVQFGYKNLLLYAKYFPKSLFKEGLGPDVRTVAAGIVLGSI